MEDKEGSAAANYHVRSGDTVVVVHNPDNGNWNRVDDDTSNAVDVTFWGGTIGNIGEDKVSYLVESRCQYLNSFIYLPQQHKGGRMVRPYYYKGDRRSNMTFPNLTTLGYYEDMRTPIDVHWDVPNLKTLYLFPDGRGNTMLNRWNVVVPEGQQQSLLRTNDRALPQRVLEQCPNLKEILLCGKPDFSRSPPERHQVLRRLVPPSPVPWECLRLLFIAVRKPNNSTEIGTAHGDDDDDDDDDHGCRRSNCMMSKLPETALDCIVSFCHLPKWKIEDFFDTA